jgi:hypothetical protein
VITARASANASPTLELSRWFEIKPPAELQDRDYLTTGWVSGWESAIRVVASGAMSAGEGVTILSSMEVLSL